MGSSLVVIRASDCQCQSRNSPRGSIPASSDTVESEGAADKAVLNTVHKKNLKNPSMCRTEPSRLQSLALQLSDKIGQLVENNERLLEQRGQVHHPVLSITLLVLAVLLMPKMKYCIN
jgi:hypothetical protein